LSARFLDFFRTQSAGGIVLIVATVIALVAANSPLAEAYHHLLETPLSIGAGDRMLSRSLHFWINDGLMVIFFFMIGLEIKREALVGELASIRQAALPIAGALGGMIAPALIFTALNGGGNAGRGWGIPMATDIAFALGILSLLGDRVPVALKVFLAALAIADDLGAVLVIAIFYTGAIALTPLLVAGAGLLLALAFNRMGMRSPLPYALLGVIIWLAFIKSGVHPTIAGVLLGFTIPVRQIYDSDRWLASVQEAIGRYRGAIDEVDLDDREEMSQRQAAVHDIENASEKALSPLVRLEHGLHPWVAFGIMPLFALANAGVPVSGDSLAGAFGSGITWGIMLGLFIGKQLGIFGFAWLAIRLRLAAMPTGTSWSALYGVAILGGIGFTMSLFVTELAYAAHPDFAADAKVGILAASIVAGVVGYVVLKRRLRSA
jgi:NhaA family Na+:H+ antiporter